MAIAALSPNSLMASPIQVNPKVSSDQQANPPQVAQDTQKGINANRSDTVTISAQALKMADDKYAAARETTKKAEEDRTAQLAEEKRLAAKKAAQNPAVRSYSAMA